MKISLILISVFVCWACICDAEDEFYWNENENGLRLGIRAAEVEKFGRSILVVQAALKNESKSVYIVELAEGRFPNLAMDVMRISKSQGDPFRQTYTLKPGELYSFLSLASRPSHAVIINPQETFLFPAFSADLKWNKFSDLRFRASFIQKEIPESKLTSWLGPDTNSEFGFSQVEKPTSFLSAVSMEVELSSAEGQSGRSGD